MPSSSSSQSFFPAVLGLLFHMWLAWLLAASAAGAAVAAAGPPSSLPVPDDCVSSQFESGIELLCSLSAINSADERTNFSVIPADHTLSLTVRCREPTMSRLEADGFKSLKHLKKLTLDGCHLRSLPARAFWGLNDLRSLTIKTRNAGVLAVDSDAFLGLGLLEELDLSGNYVRELPSNALCPLRKLRTINLSKNEVKNLNDLGNSLECLKSVKSIDLSHNQLSTVDNDIVTDSWPKLEDLRLNHNAIKAVLGNLLRSKSRLKFFDLSNNQLTTLPPELLADCTSLGRINLANNTIAFLPNRLFMRQSKSLQVLDLSGNNLGTLDAQLLSSLGALTSLDLSSNKLTSIDSGSFKGTKMLQSLKLSQNKLERLPLNPLPALRSLILSDNDLSRLPSRLFSKLPALSHLLLDKNNLEELPKRIFVNSSKLTVLDLSHNKLDDIPTAVNELVSLQSLAIGHNFVRSLTQLQLKSLWRLQASGNRLTNVSAIQLEGLPALQVLDLSQNKISSIEKNAFAMNKPLQAIRLDNNQLTRMDGLFHDLENLSWLNVSANQISVFDYAMIPKTLQWLDIHQNELSALENYFAIEDALQRLTHIDASFNQLKELGPGNLPNAVETVLLNDNHISSLVPYTFFKKSKLKKVDLSVNRLENIDRNSLRLSTDGSGEETDYLSMSRPKFYLGGNPVRCDCHMAWFKSINDHDANSLQSYPQVADLESIYCQLLYSRDQSFVPLVDAATDDFLCSYKTHCFALCHCCDYDACDCEMTCPDNCTCYHDTTWTKNIAECSNSEFRDLPDQLPMDATEIFLDGNDVGELHSHTFIGRKNLKVLFLNHSLISAVENHTFNGLAALEILHLEGNSISRLQGDEFHGLSSLRELYLQDNKIHIVNNATFKELKSLEIIFLQGNHLVDFQAWNLGSWNPSLNQVQLGGNPWSCECRFIQHFRSWLLEDQEESNPVVLDAHLLTCEEDTLVLKSECEPATATTHIQQQRNSVRDGIGEDGLSKTAAGLFQEFLPILIACISIITLFLLLLFLLFFVYRDETRIWLYSKYGIRFFHRVDGGSGGAGGGDLGLMSDVDKIFDAFVAYSAKDDAFVRQMLAPELEMPPVVPPSGNGAQGGQYKLCLFYRDLQHHMQVNPYHQVADTIVEATEASRRNIVVLSEHFLLSEWSRYDYKSGLHQALRNSSLGGGGHKKSHSKRLIVILLGDVAQKKELLDPDIRMYLKTAVVIQWGDKLFWDKLRYALPDVPAPAKTLGHHPLSTGTFASNGASSHTLRSHHLQSHANHHSLLGNGVGNGNGGGAFTPDNSFRYETYHRPSALPPTPMNGLGHATNQTNSTTMTGPRSVGGGSSTYQSIGTPDEQDSTRTMTIHI